LVLVLGITRDQSLLCVVVLIAFTSFISTLSGLWGVLVTDVFQFIIKMGMVIALAVVAVQAVGGIDSMKVKLAAIDAAHGNQGSILAFVPNMDSLWMPFITFFVYVAINWWAVWYPGAEPGGGGFIAQRMFSAKDEKNSLLATLFFTIMHYAVRPWPWILTALASVILYPNLADPETGYVKVMVDYLPWYLRGLMVAAFAAAYMSTIATQLNWGASYLVNDFYRRFLKKNETDKHYVIVSQIATVLLTILSLLVTRHMNSVSGAWKLLTLTGAGTGLVLLVRWFWWRVNAWSEVSSMVAAFIVSLALELGFGFNMDQPRDFAWIIIITVGITTATWLATTFLTRPEPDDVLITFYRRTRPSLAGWARIAAKAPDVKPSSDGWYNALDWIAGCGLIYGLLFGVGKLILKEWTPAFVLLAVGLAGGIVIFWDLNRRGWSTVVD
jgi:solute:Na+ symporter, SSS family